MEGTFSNDGSLDKKGPGHGVQGEGLGGSNIGGVDDKKSHQADKVASETGRKEKDGYLSANAGAGVGYDPASGGASSIMEKPEGGRLADAQGQATTSGNPGSTQRNDQKTQVIADKQLISSSTLGFRCMGLNA
ncbi:hypothetical protein WJX84_012068 [Apatococcus fuscideae]|uniref:Uncharacterized protein n=1 Tax=Apatococcus fuscideae TaxID=2026836 RepID=A0AAW1T982_9CHLO